MKKILKRILAILLVLAVLGGLGFSYIVGDEVFKGITMLVSREDTLKNEKNYFEEAFDELEKLYDVEYLSVSSSEFDHEIPAVYVKKEGNEDIAVIVHALGGTKKSYPELARILLDLGFNVVSYDQRNSGENTADYNTFGALESYDALDMVAFAETKAGADSKVMLWGQSYGGITAAIALGRDETHIDYLVLDCPVSDGKEMTMGVLEDVEEDQGIPASFMVFLGNIFLKTRLGFDLDDTNVAAWVKDTDRPVLITNSSIDDVTPPHMGQDIYDAIPHDKKILYTVDDYEHAKFPTEEPERYKALLGEFLEKY
jgi:fermentation-respiration switch protein FrsA (DUF1100 family)